MLQFGYLITFLIGSFSSPILVAARFCEGGHRCSPPKECCPQGCCYLYAPPSAPRSPPPATDHVLNLFFINHWYFWCLVLAIILAILCACSLWKKRRQLCGWGTTDHHTQSEGDSAGSCYAPPQYSRCSSFHHPPPPYTEVTSKPDLYPLVFTCNGDNGKTGASYLMVQYFRNYIVRPAGSLSATSTVDSLSSSFICTANEANTLVPPPYSRAASPDVGIHSNYQHHFMIPRSASQLACSQIMDSSHSRNNNSSNMTNNSNSNTHHHSQHQQQQHQQLQHPAIAFGSQLRTSESVNFQNIRSINNSERATTVIGSQSDQQFRYIATSNSSLSDIFVNNNNNYNSNNNNNNNGSNNNSNNINTSMHSNNHNHNNNNNSINVNINSTGMNAEAGTTNNQAQAQITNHNLLYKNNSTNQFNTNTNTNNPIYNSCGSIGGISITVPVAKDGESDYRDLDVLRHSLETCCQILQQQQMPSVSFNSEDSPVNIDMVKKFDGIRSYVTSTTCSAVSSLANIGSPSSPPQATSPTGEVKELLEQIRQLQHDNSLESTSNVEAQQFSNEHVMKSSITTPAISVAPSLRRPSTLQSKKKFFSKPNKAMYIPINNSNTRSIRSPVGAASSFLGRGRGRRGWISRSAPTTPGTTLPPSRLGDDSPLLNEHDEDAEQNT